MPRNLWAPWRLDYLNAASDDEGPARPRPGGEGCFLCDAASTGDRAADGPTMNDQRDDDAEKLVLHRGEFNTILLNRYPYTNGHLLVSPFEHVADLGDLTAEARAELMEFAELGNRLVRAAVHCQGVNLGMNLGAAAGAGVPGHLHLHVVPRWHGDSTFMDIVGQVRLIPEALADSYEKLRAALAAMA